MALLFTESFDETDYWPYKWESVAQGSYGYSAGRFGKGYAAGSTNHTIWRTVPPRTEVVAGFAYYPWSPANYNYGTGHFRMMGTGVSWADSVLITGHDGDWKLKVMLNAYAGNGSVLAEGTIDLAQFVWCYIELKVKRHATNGGVWLRVNGQDDVKTGCYADTPVSQNTGSTAIQSIALNHPNHVYAGGGGVWDDVYFLDTTGSKNNDFLGDVRVEPIFPTGAGQYSQWTPSPAVANYLNVDEYAYDTDSTYNYTATLNYIDTFALGNITPTAGTIYGVQTMTVARKDNAGVRMLAPVLRQGTTDVVGSSRTLGNSYGGYLQCYDVQPVPGTDWSVETVNSLECGYKLTG